MDTGPRDPTLQEPGSGDQQSPHHAAPAQAQEPDASSQSQNQATSSRPQNQTTSSLLQNQDASSQSQNLTESTQSPHPTTCNQAKGQTTSSQEQNQITCNQPQGQTTFNKVQTHTTSNHLPNQATSGQSDMQVISSQSQCQTASNQSQDQITLNQPQNQSMANPSCPGNNSILLARPAEWNSAKATAGELDLAEKLEHEEPVSEADTCRRAGRSLLQILLLVLLLYLFVCVLDLLAKSVRLIGGRTASDIFAQGRLLSNPVVDLMLGCVFTLLVQSSSISTSIVVSMVAADGESSSRTCLDRR